MVELLRIIYRVVAELDVYKKTVAVWVGRFYPVRVLCLVRVVELRVAPACLPAAQAG